jgi:RecA/RadA recombinase
VNESVESEEREESVRLDATGEDILKSTSRLNFLSTGSPAIDRILGGGLREGRMVEFYGRSNSGKTQLAMQAVLMAAAAGLRSLYVDTEGGFRPERVEEMASVRGMKAGGLLDRVVYVRCDSSWAQMDTIRKMKSREATKECRLVVVDTLTRNFTIDLPGSANLQNRQAALNVHLSEMARDAYINSRAYLLTNRVTFGESHDVRIGGQTVEQLVSQSVLLEREASKVSVRLIKENERAQAEMGKEGIR